MICNGKYEFTLSRIWIQTLRMELFRYLTRKRCRWWIGGSVKRSVWIAVKSRKAIVNSALEFYNLACSLFKKIIIKFVAKGKVKEKITMLDDQWEGLKNIPGIQSKHFFQSEEAHSISVAHCLILNAHWFWNHQNPPLIQSDWADDDLEPLTNHKIRKRFPGPDKSVPSVSDQSK